VAELVDDGDEAIEQLIAAAFGLEKPVRQLKPCAYGARSDNVSSSPSTPSPKSR